MLIQAVKRSPLDLRRPLGITPEAAGDLLPSFQRRRVGANRIVHVRWDGESL
jgi:hypothetical protein